MTFALLAAGLVFGLLASRFSWLPEATPQRLNFFIINVALPAMILLKVPTLELDSNALVPVASAWLVILSSALMVWVLSRLYNWPTSTRGALLLVVPLTNSAYLGIPLLDALTDDRVVAYAAFYDQFGTFLGLAIYAPIVIAVLGDAKTGGDQRTGGRRIWSLFIEVLKRLFSFVPFPVLLVAAIFMSADTLPGWALTPLQIIGATMGPLAAFIIGFSLQFTVPSSLRTPLIAGLILRLLVAPALVFSATQLFSLSGAAVTASILQAGMPTMITAGLVGIAAGFSQRLIIAMLGLSTLLGFVTVSVLFVLVGGL